MQASLACNRLGWPLKWAHNQRSLVQIQPPQPRLSHLFERPTLLEEGERGLEDWIRVFRQTLIESMGEGSGQRWIREVERQCRADLFHDGSWVLDYRRLRIAAWKA